MKFAHAQYCDFLVWRKNEFIIDRILPDVSFIDNALAKANIFVKTALLPELLGKWFTKQQTITVRPTTQTTHLCLRTCTVETALLSVQETC